MSELQYLLNQKTKSTPWSCRKIRVLSNDPKCVVFGTTIPKHIAYQFLNVQMTISTSGQSIILTASGTGDENR